MSAVQRALLDCLGHRRAQERDDGARVVAANHSAARHDHVGPRLDKTGAEGEACVTLKTIRAYRMLIFYLGALVNGVGTDPPVHLDVQRRELTAQPAHLFACTEGRRSLVT